MSSTLLHDAFVYESDAEFVETLAPIVVDGLASGDEICAVIPAANMEVLRESLGGHAPDVQFVDATEWYRSPARTIAAYHDVICRVVASGAPGVRVIGEVQFGDTALEHADWTRYEAALNVAFQDCHAWIICPYDARSLPESVVVDALRTHPHVLDGGERHPTSEFTDPIHFAEPLPIEMPDRLLDALELNGDLRSVRQLVARTTAQVGLSPERAAEVCLAVNEVTTNSMEHGRAPVHVRAWSSDDSLVYEVADAGSGPAELLLGFIPPGGHQPRGRGLWITRQLADRFEIVSTSTGTAALIQISLT
jgi:anti-sigma regulatory factor (Ser/Thr protein kinase)